MKLFRYILSALVGVSLFASCIEEEPVASYNLAIELDKSVVAVGSEGGSATIEVNSGDITWKATSSADWITFTPATGSGTTKVTITVGESDEDRTGEVSLQAGKLEKLITVVQTGDPHGLTEDDPLTCAEAVVICGKLADKATTSKKYYVKGIITAIVEEFGTQYGNATFWMGDAEGEKTFEAYRVYYFDNAKYDDPTKQNISEGDNVVIYGILMNYGGQAETSQNAAYLYKLDANTAPTISCKEPEKVVAASETEATFTIAPKNLTEGWTVSTDASWIKDYTKSGAKDATEIKVSFDANTETEAREATFTVKSAGAKDITLTLKQGGYSAVGTLDNPYTVAQVIEAIKNNSAAGNVYIKGIVSKAVYTYSESYNTGTFWISDDGVYNDNLDKDFECYSVYWIGGSLESPVAAADIKGNYSVGDEVVIYGAVTAYTKNDVTTYETASKKAKIYSINWAQTDENGLGSVAYPFNIAGAEKFIDDTQAAVKAASDAGATLTLPDVAVKGKVSAVLYEFSADYGTGTFWISDDGTAYGVSDDKKSTTEPAKDFEVYSAYFLENKPWEEGNAQVAVGDEVIIKGQLTLYKSTYETSSKKAYLYSLNGVTEASAGPVDNWDYTPGAAYEDASNLWKANAAGNENFYYYNATGADWNGTDVVSDEVPFLTKTQSTYVLDYPEATTSGIWQKQFFIFPKDGHFVGLSADKKYSLSITVGSNVNAPAFFKIEKYDANHAKREGALIWEKGEFTLDPAAPVVIEHEIMGVDCDNVNLVFAFGGNPAEAKVYIKDITIAAPEEPQTLGEYDTNVKDAISNLTSAYTDGVATVNGVENVFTLKFGTSSKYGSATVTLPAGTKSVSFYGVGWKGNPASLKITLGGNVIPVDLKANDGATGNSPYTITVTEADKYSFNLGGALPSATPVTVETYEGNNTGKRAILFGIQASTEEIAVAPKGITIDGDLGDWDAVETKFEGVNNRIVEWKATSDASNVYFYYKMTAEKIKTDGSSSFYIGFNLDNDASTGSQGEHGAAGNNAGLEALAYFYPWTSAANAVITAGEDPASWIDNPVGTKVDGAKLKVGGTISGDFAYIEVSVPRSALGSPASGAEITVKTAVQYYPTNAEKIALK